MTVSGARSISLVILAVAVLLAVSAQLQRVRDARYPPPPLTEDSLYVTSDTALRRLTTGYSALAADLYWIRTIQYYGGLRRRLAAYRQGFESADSLPTNYDLLYPLLNVTTTLDPRLSVAYRFGSIFLAEPFPGGAGRADLAIALLEKGIREQPEKWEYMQDIGFVYYWWLHDYEAAAIWFERAGNVPGAPWWLRSLAATTLSEGGDRSSSRRIWQSLAETPDNEWLRNDARRRLRQLDALEQIEELQRLVDRVTAESGRPPSDWVALVQTGRLPGIPVDPDMAPYVLGPTGRVAISPSSPLFPLPDEPKRLVPEL